MKQSIGIRREHTGSWERRAALTPDQVNDLVGKCGINVVVEPSIARVFSDSEYAAAGASVSEDLFACNVILGLREIPPDRVLPGRAYGFFSHTVKAQRYNMSMLRAMVDGGCTLLDYELIVNDAGTRLVFLGRYAGYAGMIDSLWALGRRLEAEGIATPFANLLRAYEYDGLADARNAVSAVGDQIRAEGLPREITPFVCGFLGRGHVSGGAEEIFRLLPSVAVQPDDLASLGRGGYSRNAVYRVLFRKKDLYEPVVKRGGGSGTFDDDVFESDPSAFQTTLERYTAHLTMVINGVFWSPRYPRLLTRSHIRDLFSSTPEPRLRLVGDLACDIEGAVEFTVRATERDNPVYVYEPNSEEIVTGWAGEGPVVLAVNKLASEFPREATLSLGGALLPFLPTLARADFGRSFERLSLPHAVRRAVIAHGGSLTTNFRYLNDYLL